MDVTDHHARRAHTQLGAERHHVELGTPKGSPMRIPLIAKRKAGRQSGMSLIELMFAGFILVVGFMGSLILIFIAIATNTRNKVDTTGTMIAQMVIEEVNVMSTNNGVTTIPIT